MNRENELGLFKPGFLVKISMATTSVISPHFGGGALLFEA